MLAGENITVVRSDRHILDKVSVAFEPGKLSVVLGPNGAGKSTLLKVLTGVLNPDQGQVLFEGENLHDIRIEDIARRRAVLAQESLMQFDFNVEEVVLLGRIPHLSGWENAHDRAACERALEAVEMTDFRYRRYPSLSGGEKQRVQLARVLAQLDRDTSQEAGAPWLFLDEPTSALDLRYQHATLSCVRGLSRSKGLGVCAILHDLNLAMRYADHVVLLSQGTVAACGSPRETLTAEMVAEVYQVHAEVLTGAADNLPFIQTQQR